MNQKQSDLTTTAANLQQLLTLIRAIPANRRAGKSSARDPHWILVDLREGPTWIPNDWDVPILTAETTTLFVRTRS